MSDEFLRRKEAGEYLLSRYGFSSPKALAKLATVGGGPVFHKAGHACIYRRADLDKWALDKLGAPVASTADYRRKPDQAA